MWELLSQAAPGVLVYLCMESPPHLAEGLWVQSRPAYWMGESFPAIEEEGLCWPRSGLALGPVSFWPSGEKISCKRRRTP